MSIQYTIILLSLIITNWGFSNNCTFTIENVTLLKSNDGDILTIYLEDFDRNNYQSNHNIFTVEINQTGSDCINPPFTIQYTLKIYAPEIGLNHYETFYVGERILDMDKASQIYRSSDYNLVSGLTIQSENLISYISQSGKLPNGNYLFQFEIKNGSGILLDKKSESLEINRPLVLELLSPGGTLSELTHAYTYSTVPIFNWYSDFCNQCNYGIRVCEYNQDEHHSLSNALDDWSLIPKDQSSKYHAIPWNTFSFQYPEEGHLDLEVGKHYVWQILRSYETTIEPHYDYSPIYIFEVRSPTKEQLDFSDPYLSLVQSLIGNEQFNLWFSTGGELEQFVTAGKSIWINGEKIHIDALYALVSELNQGKITFDKLQIK
jgi:hypothetical protein